MTDTRTIILAGDGRHVTVSGRAVPFAEISPDTLRAVTILAGMGVHGWICHVTGDYYGTGTIKIEPISEHVDDALFDAAVSAFVQLRETGEKRPVSVPPTNRVVAH